MMGAIGRGAWIATALLLVAMTLAFALGRDSWDRTVTEPRADAAYYYVYLPSMVLDGDLDFSDQYQVTKNVYRLRNTSTGRPGNVFGIGPAVFELPAFLIGHAIARLTGSSGDGFSGWETALCTWCSIPFTLAALLLAYRLARRRLGPGLHAYAGPLLALVGGPVLYYAIRQPGYSHPFATLFGTWLIERWDASYDNAPRSLRTWLVLGVAAGCAMLARPQLATWVVLLFPMAAIDDLRHRGTVALSAIALRWLAAGGVAFAMFFPQLAAWNAVYGEWYIVPQGAGFMRWDSPAWSETLFSSRNGLLPWAPLYAPMLICALVLARRLPRLVVALVIGLLAQAVVNGAAWDWWAGGSFGGRRFDSTYVLFALGAAAGLQWAFGAIQRFHATVRSWTNWAVNARVAAATVALITSTLVGIATVELAWDTSITTARIGGGRSAASIWEKRGFRGELAAWLSSASNAPARAVYAIRYDVALSSYDQVVGVHVLGETYPHLNSYPDKRRDTIQVGKPDVRHRGLVAADARRALIEGNARLLVGINRRGDVVLRLPVVAKTATTLTASWNGDPQVFELRAGASTVTVAGSTVRGTNILELTTPGVVTLGSIEIEARD